MRVANESDLGARTLRADDVQLRREFERAVLPCYGSLRASALRMTVSASDADDLVQETLLRAWRFWPSYSERDQCRGWLQRIMANTFCSACRTHARRRTQLGEYAVFQAAHLASTTSTSMSSAEPEPHRLVTHEQLACSLSALKVEQRHILHLVDVDQRSYREAASALGCPIGTVMSRLHRARAALRSELQRAC